MIPQVATPTADLGQSYAPDPRSGIVTVDLVPAVDGDLGTVAGSSRLAQDVTKFLYTPVGADPFSPDYGNPLWGDIGLPVAADVGTYGAALESALADFAARQAADAATGQLATDEQLDSWDPPTLSLAGGTLTIGLRLYSRAQTTALVAAAIPVSSTSP
jgi:hypothetical protein